MHVDKLKKYIMEIINLYNDCHDSNTKYHYFIELMAIRRILECFDCCIIYEVEKGEICGYAFLEYNAKEV